MQKGETPEDHENPNNEPENQGEYQGSRDPQVPRYQREERQHEKWTVQGNKRIRGEGATPQKKAKTSEPRASHNEGKEGKGNKRRCKKVPSPNP